MPSLEESKKIVLALVDKGGFVIKVSEPDLPFYIEEMEYLADILRKHVWWILDDPPQYLKIIVEAIRTFKWRCCVKLKGGEIKAFDYLEDWGLYHCPGENTYMVISDAVDWRYYADSLKVFLTRDKSKAEEEYKKLAEEIEGGAPWLEE